MRAEGGPRAGSPRAAPTPAATVVLVRDRAPGGFEVFLVQRNRRMGFMGGMHVFPGGKLAESDCAAPMRARLIDPDAHAGVWGEGFDATRCAGLGVAAIRETFEEAGVLLAEGCATSELARERAELLAGADFARLLDACGARLRLSSLTPLSRWITPSAEPRRFDTCFYLARAPAGQQASHDRGETIAARWRSPRKALDEAAAGEIRLSPPTARTLESLLPASSAAEVIATAEGRRPPVIEPIIRPEGENMVILFPGDPEHPVRERALPGPTRAVLRRRR